MVTLGIVPEQFVIAEGVNGEVLGIGQVEDKESGAYKKIRTLVVDRKARRRGIATSIVDELLGETSEADVFLTTVEQSKAFFESIGFEEVGLSDMPMDMRLEVAAGTLMARISINQRCMVMRRKA